MSQFQDNSIFWIEVEKIRPNPYQPRREFNPDRLNDLAESIRQYGVLQPLVVTRKEKIKEDGGLLVEYELIAGERRHRASKIANLSQVPVIIRSADEDAQVKLELAIIENLQREDLNPVERAEAFSRLVEEFEFTHTKIAEKIGRSREYVSNSIRILQLPDEMRGAIISGKISEGHGRTLMMLRDKPAEQKTLFKEVVHKQMTVRETEEIARKIAKDKVRKHKNKPDPEMVKLEEQLSDTFGTRVKIERKKVGGKLVIDFFSTSDLRSILELVQSGGDIEMEDLLERFIEQKNNEPDDISEEQEVTVEDALAQIAEETSEPLENLSDPDDSNRAETLGTLINQKREAKEQESGAQDESENEEGSVNPQPEDEERMMVEDISDEEVAEPSTPELAEEDNLSSEEVSENTQEENDEDDEKETSDDLYSISNFSI